MKKILILQVRLLILILFGVFSSQIEVFSQITECFVDDSGLNLGERVPLVPDVTCLYENLTNSDFDEMEELVVYVNFHFIPNANGQTFHFNPNGNPLLYAPTFIADIVNRANIDFADVDQNAIGTSGKVNDSKIRIRLYTESGNPNDPNGGIFIYSSNAIPIL